MKETILNFIKEQFGSKKNAHRPYCRFPEEECSCKELDDIDYDTSLIRGGIIDSFSTIVLVVFLQKKFGIKIPDKETNVENFDTVNKMVNLIEKLKV